MSLDHTEVQYQTLLIMLLQELFSMIHAKKKQTKSTKLMSVLMKNISVKCSSYASDLPLFHR